MVGSQGDRRGTWTAHVASSVTVVLFTVSVAFTVAVAPRARGEDLTAEEQEHLGKMDEQSVREILELARDIISWEAAIKDVRQGLQAAKDETGSLDETVGAAEDPFDKIIVVAEFILKRRETFAKFVALGDKLDNSLAKVEKAGANVVTDPEIDLNIDEMREVARSFAKISTGEEIAAELERIIMIIKALKNPAEFAKRFADQEITKWLAEPREAGGIAFRIEKTDPSKSLFTEDADIRIVMEYQEGIAVSASGLYFKYREGQVPEPRFDKLKVDESSLNSLVNNGLKYLGDAIPAEFGLPIKISNPRFNDFSVTGGKPPGSLSFDVEIGGFLDFADTLKLEAKDVTIDAQGKVTVEGGFTFKDDTTKIPIGTTGLIFDGYYITLRPEDKEKTVTIGTHLAPASGDEVLALDINITFGFPIKKIIYEGHLVLARVERIGKIDGEISAEHITGNLVIPSGTTLPIKEILQAEFHFELNKKGFTADGMVAIFGAAEANMDMALRFDGSGHFTATEQYRLAGVNVDASLRVDVEKGFKKISLEALLAVDVDLKLFRADASVLVNAASDEGINVVARAMGAEATFEVDSLDDLTPHRIAQELLKEMDDILQNIAAAAAKWESDKKELLAKWEKHWRESLHNEAKKYGVDALRTGDPNADRVLGDIAREGKQGGKWVSDVWKKSGKEASEFVKNPADKLASLPSNVGRELENFGGSVSSGFKNATSSLFGGGSSDDEPSGPSPAELRARDLHKKVETKIEPLVAACSRVRVHETPRAEKGKSGAQTSELRFRFDNAVGASRGKGNGTVGLTVGASGYRSRVSYREKDKADRDYSSDVKGASIEFAAVVPQDSRDLKKDEVQGKPKARIRVEPIKDASGMNATRLAHIEIQRLVERHLPEVEIEGPKMHYVSQLAVHNRTKEPIKVWVQRRSRRYDGQKLVWEWTPAEPGSRDAHRFKLEPGQKEVLEVVTGYSHHVSETSEVELASTEPLTASRVRIWAESESGERWMQYKTKDRWLVKRDPKLREARGYFADKVRTYTHVIEPKSGGRIYSERLVQLTNKTAEPLKVNLRYRTNEGGETSWRSLDSFEIPPGGRGFPSTSEGMKVRASRIRFTAQSEHFYFGKHKNKSLYLVEETDDRRIYFADKIGHFEHVFDSPVADSRSSTNSR